MVRREKKGGKKREETPLHAFGIAPPLSNAERIGISRKKKIKDKLIQQVL